ncbi:hypothetical protein [Micromonospora sp. CP22]|uniref:hypothetical protein n=1 Tax=Micromonospora sp. CP22 TaxID=2580517 RepID=UPI0012BC8627|nr:hypothetical protein [Micromonospora sp. CP22]MTK04707.1 hypothetical protein [Micromonospora sp. CP22]
MTSGKFFGPDFVARHRQQFGDLPSDRRRLTFDIAVEPQFQHWRDWYDEQLALLPSSDAEQLAGRLWKDEFFWPVTMELAAGAALRSAGYLVAYERQYGGLTPDWTVLSPDDDPVMFVEVHTDQPPRETFARQRAWKALEQRIAKISVGVVLVLKAGNMPPKVPDAGTAKKVAQEVRQRLLQSPSATSITAYGYTFLVLADRFGPVASANGLFAQFAAPSGVAGPVDAARLTRAVNDKVRKYADLAARYDVPLVIAAGAHRFTRVDLDDVDRLIAGEPTISFQFNIGDAFIGAQKINLAHPPRWVMPADLSALLWIDNQPPFATSNARNLWMSVGRRTLPTSSKPGIE